MRSVPLFMGPIAFLSVAQQGARPHLLHFAVIGPDVVSNLSLAVSAHGLR